LRGPIPSQRKLKRFGKESHDEVSESAPYRPSFLADRAINCDSARFRYSARGYSENARGRGLLVKEGEKGVATFKTKNAQSFWKSDGYIFVFDCDQEKMLANANLAIAGAPLKRLHDSLGLYLAKPLCENGRRPNGGWIEIHQPKPNTTKVVRKMLYVRPVPGTTYQVGSGVYDDTLTVEELNELSDSH
jgi:hypothetical protein